MALSDIADMTASASLRARITAAAAQQGRDGGWVSTYLTQLCSSDGWDSAWATARTDPHRGNYNPDTGWRTDVISDQMITTAVTTLIEVQTTTGSWTA
jgi:hypothetical protein